LPAARRVLPLKLIYSFRGFPLTGLGVAA
jgi:hypothetical protein